MIKIEQLAKMLNDSLNESNIEIDNEIYKFRIVLDMADFKYPERDGNKINVYIHGQLNQVNSDIDTNNGGFFSGTLDTRLDLLIPILDNQNIESKNLSSKVRNVLDSFFSQNGNGVMIV